MLALLGEEENYRAALLGRSYDDISALSELTAYLLQCNYANQIEGVNFRTFYLMCVQQLYFVLNSNYKTFVQTSLRSHKILTIQHGNPCHLLILSNPCTVHKKYQAGREQINLCVFFYACLLRLMWICTGNRLMGNIHIHLKIYF